jgi:hypothetical protein
MPIELIYLAFGDDIPQYTPLEGGVGINYLFCLNDTEENIKKICNENKCIPYNFTEIEINDRMYNSKYRAATKYFDKDPYELRMD